ncbi:phage protein [Streptococcus dysgalactiae]|nr:phage protein [Streptococcus dysgalactiae]
MTLQNIPDGFFYRLIEQTVDIILVWDKDTQIGSYYISIHDKYSFEYGRNVNIYKIVSSTQADVYKANKYNYQSLSKPDTSVQKPSAAMGLYQSITIDGLPIARVICNNQVIWSQSAEPQEVYNITAYVDANVSKLNDYAVIDYSRDFATYGVIWDRVDKVAVEVDGKIVAKLQKPVRTVAGGGAMLSIETWTYPSDGIDKYKNPTFKISQH